MDPAELAWVETNLSVARIAQLERSPLPGRFDLDHLRAIHRHVFGDVYDWAGELRTVALGRGAAFCPPDELAGTAERVFTGLARLGYLRGRRLAPFVEDLTAFLAALNHLHPFRDGNGRAQRTFLSQLAVAAGYRIHWTAMDPAENIAASRAALVDDDLCPLRALLQRLVVPAPRPAPSERQQPPKGVGCEPPRRRSR